MKKSLLNIITLALVIINTILSVIMVFVVVPSMQNSNNVIKKVAQAINIELDEEETDASDIPIDDCTTFEIDSKMTFALKKGSDGKEHYVVINAALLLNTGNKDYSKYKDSLVEKKTVIMQHIQDVVQKYTATELQSNPNAIRDEALKDLQELFNSKFIVEVIFGTTTIQ